MAYEKGTKRNRETGYEHNQAQVGGLSRFEKYPQEALANKHLITLDMPCKVYEETPTGDSFVGDNTQYHDVHVPAGSGFVLPYPNTLGTRMYNPDTKRFIRADVVNEFFKYWEDEEEVKYAVGSKVYPSKDLEFTAVYDENVILASDILLTPSIGFISNEVWEVPEEQPFKQGAELEVILLDSEGAPDVTYQDYTFIWNRSGVSIRKDVDNKLIIEPTDALINPKMPLIITIRSKDESLSRVIYVYGHAEQRPRETDGHINYAPTEPVVNEEEGTEG